MPNDPSPGGGRAAPGIDHERFAPGSGRPRERDAPCSPGVGHTPDPGHRQHTGVPRVGHDPGHQQPFFASSLENRTKPEPKQNKKSFFATYLAFWTDSVCINKKTVQKSSQVAEKQKKKYFLPARPRDSAAAATAPPPGAPRANARALVARGPGYPGQRPAKCGPTPGSGVPRRCLGFARPLPGLGSLGIAH